MNSIERGFEYEPSWDHTYETFGARQRARLLQAKYDQNAIDVESRVVTGSVIEAPADKAELEFNPLDTGCCDVFEQTLGG